MTQPDREDAPMLAALRVVAVLHALDLFLQPVLAGMFLSGQDTQIDTHADNASLVLLLGLTLSVLAFLAWRRNLVSRHIFTQATVIFLLEGAQMAVGYGHIMWAHIPLGVLLFSGTAVLMTRVMPPQRTAAGRGQGAAETQLAEVHKISEGAE